MSTSKSVGATARVKTPGQTPQIKTLKDAEHVKTPAEAPRAVFKNVPTVYVSPSAKPIHHGGKTSSLAFSYRLDPKKYHRPQVMKPLETVSESPKPEKKSKSHTPVFFVNAKEKEGMAWAPKTCTTEKKAMKEFQCPKGAVAASS